MKKIVKIKKNLSLDSNVVKKLETIATQNRRDVSSEVERLVEDEAKRLGVEEKKAA